MDIVFCDESSQELTLDLNIGCIRVVEVKVNTTEYWNSLTEFVPLRGEVIIYSDNSVTSEGVAVPAMKVGDGSTPLSDLEFVSTVSGEFVTQLNEHIQNGSIHLTPEEKMNLSNLGWLAFRNAASGLFTPVGVVSQPAFTGNESTSTGVFTPDGTVSAPHITITPSMENVYVASSITSGGAVSEGSAASCTFPQLQTTVVNENLTLSWTNGSFTPNTPTSVTLPQFTSHQLISDIESAEASQPIFTGSEGNVSVTGTPSGTVSQPIFTGIQSSVTVS